MIFCISSSLYCQSPPPQGPPPAAVGVKFPVPGLQGGRVLLLCGQDWWSLTSVWPFDAY